MEKSIPDSRNSMRIETGESIWCIYLGGCCSSIHPFFVNHVQDIMLQSKFKGDDGRRSRTGRKRLDHEKKVRF